MDYHAGWATMDQGCGSYGFEVSACGEAVGARNDLSGQVPATERVRRLSVALVSCELEPSLCMRAVLPHTEAMLPDLRRQKLRRRVALRRERAQ